MRTKTFGHTRNVLSAKQEKELMGGEIKLLHAHVVHGSAHFIAKIPGLID
jgi:hypothetical protein